MAPALRAPPPQRPGTGPCRHCGVALSALEARRGPVCGRPACRHQADRQQALAVRDEHVSARRASAALRWGDDAVARAPVVWIVPHDTRLVPLTRQRRLVHQAHLAAVAAELSAHPGRTDAEPDAPPASGGALAAPLCTFCAGRCCRFGAGSHAFITAALLRRWLDQHPGRTPEEAAAQYLSLLPRHHVQDSCLHHGRYGCTLPREMRSELCNRYQCDGLRQAQDHDLAGRGSGLVAAMDRSPAQAALAWLQPAGARRLPRLPRRRRRKDPTVPGLV